MKTYTTVQGDMWDGIAFTQMGNTKYTDALMSLNSEHVHYFIFPAGIELQIPEIAEESETSLPPWKKVSG